jgi:hypothetical protein
MRFVVLVVAISTLPLTCAYAPASSIDNSPTALAELQTKADQAQPRDKCFLYAELVSQMTDLASQQFNSGDSGQASETLKRVQRYAEKIHTGVADDSRKLRDAESLTRAEGLPRLLTIAPIEADSFDFFRLCASDFLSSELMELIVD